MRRILLIALLVLLVGISGSAAAQNETTPASNESIEWIDETTGIVDVAHIDGEVEVRLFSEEDRPVMLSDAFGPMERGPIDQERRVLKGGEVSTVRVPVTTWNGNVGVVISTEDVTYAVPVETSGGAVLGTEHSTGQVLFSAGVGGVSGVGAVAVLLRYFGSRLMTRRDL